MIFPVLLNNHFFIIFVDRYARKITLRMKTRAVVRDYTSENQSMNAYTNLPKVRARFAVKYPMADNKLVARSENKMRLRMKIRIVKPEN